MNPFLIDLLDVDQTDILAQHGFNREKQKNLESLKQKGATLNEEEKIKN